MPTPPLQSSPFIHLAFSLRYMMWQVLLALLPALSVLLYYQGSRWLFQLALSAVVALSVEALMLIIRKKPRKLQTLSDASALLTAFLLALSAPITLSPWLLALGIAFALIFGKHLYGGIGMNLFNPAMLGYTFLLLSFPAQMSAHLPLDAGIDATTAATLLDHSRALRIEQTPLPDYPISPPTYLLNLAWLAGGAYLVWRRCADYRLIVSVLLGILITASLFYAINPQNYLSPLLHLTSGASLFGACFIATDPVSAATTPRGRWIYGLLIGLLTVCIRNLGNFPDGFAFAILLTNALVIFLDPLTQPHYR